MKLYATVTSERAQKSQGGNLFVEVQVRGEDRETILAALRVYYNQAGKLEITYAPHERCADCREPMYTIVQAHHHTENGRDVTKGEKQKGEVCSYKHPHNGECLIHN